MARLALALLVVFAAASCTSMKRDRPAANPSASKGTTYSATKEADLPASGGASAPKMESKRNVAEQDCSKPVDLTQGQGNLRCK